MDTCPQIRWVVRSRIMLRDRNACGPIGRLSPEFSCSLPMGAKKQAEISAQGQNMSPIPAAQYLRMSTEHQHLSTFYRTRSGIAANTASIP